MGQSDQLHEHLHPVRIEEDLHVLLVVEQLLDEHEEAITLGPVLTLLNNKWWMDTSKSMVAETHYVTQMHTIQSQWSHTYVHTSYNSCAIIGN